MVAPVPQTFTSLAGSSGTTALVPVPSGVADKDIIVVCVYMESTGVITGLPAGFTLKQQVTCTGSHVHSQNIFWKLATGADSGTYSFTLPATVWSEGWAARISGALLTGDPFGVPVNSATSNSTGSSAVTPAVATLTPTSNDCLIIFSGSDWNGGSPHNTWTPPTGFTERVDSEAVTMATLAQTTAAATGSVTATATNADVGRTGLVAYLLPTGPVAEPVVAPSAAATTRSSSW